MRFEPHRAAEPSLDGPRRPARPHDVHDRSRHREGLRRRALVPPRGRRHPRVGAHRRRLVLRAGRHAARPRRRGARVLHLRSRASSRRCSRTSSPTTLCSLRPHQDRLCVTVEMPPAGEPLFYRSVIRSDARLTYGQAAAPRGGAAHPRAAGLAGELATALRDRALRARRAAGARRPRSSRSASTDGRRRRRVARGRAARAHARRGADDPARTSRSARSSPAAAARRSTACTSGPTRRRSSTCSRSSPTSACRRRRRRRARRRRQAATLAGEISRRVTAVRRAVGPRAGGVPGARAAGAQAGAVRPAEPRPLRAREHRRTATSPRRSGATPTSSSTARSCGSSGSATTRSPTTSGDLAEHTSAREREAGAARVPRRRHLPRLAARGRLASAAGRSAWEGEITGLIGSGLFVRFGRRVRGVPAGAPPARRVLRAEPARHRARRAAAPAARYRLGDPIEVRVESIARTRARSSSHLHTRARRAVGPLGRKRAGAGDDGRFRRYLLEMLTTAERDLLGRLTDDGWPLRVLAPHDEAQHAEVQQTAISLLGQGLVEVYAGPQDARVTQPEAEAVLAADESWDPDARTPIWFICASPAGNALLASDR